jgi:hypothetical protein
MATELIEMTDDPFRNACNSHSFGNLQEIRLVRTCGPSTMKDRVCLQLSVGQEGSPNQEIIFLTRTQAHVLRDILTEHILYGQESETETIMDPAT